MAHLVDFLVCETEKEALSIVGSDAWVECALSEATDDRTVFEQDDGKQILLLVEVSVEVCCVEGIESVDQLGPELSANEVFELMSEEESFAVFHFWQNGRVIKVLQLHYVHHDLLEDVTIQLYLLEDSHAEFILQMTHFLLDQVFEFEKFSCYILLGLQLIVKPIVLLF